MGKSHRKPGTRFAKFEAHVTKLKSWQALSPSARIIYLHLDLRCFASKTATVNNNGRVEVSVADLAREANFNRKTATTALAELQHTGFIICERPFLPGVEGRGRPSRWRLTMRPTANGSASLEPLKWKPENGYPLVVHTAALPKRYLKHGVEKLKNPSRNSEQGNVRNSGQGGFSSEVSHVPKNGTRQPPHLGPKFGTSLQSMPCTPEANSAGRGPAPDTKLSEFGAGCETARRLKALRQMRLGLTADNLRSMVGAIELEAERAAWVKARLPNEPVTFRTRWKGRADLAQPTIASTMRSRITFTRA